MGRHHGSKKGAGPKRRFTKLSEFIAAEQYGWRVHEMLRNRRIAVARALREQREQEQANSVPVETKKRRRVIATNDIYTKED